MGQLPPPAAECPISEVVQRARLQVDEQGTTAAAATRVSMPMAASAVGFQMSVDRPFVVAIQDVPTGTLLFAGVVGDPSA